MNIKGLVGAAVFVFTAALLVPLYESYNATGYVIAGLVGCITAGTSIFILSIWLGKQEEKKTSVSLIQNTLLESKQQLIEQQESFVSSTMLMQEQLQKVIIESVAFQQQILTEMKAAVNEMSLIGVNQKDQTSRMVSQLDGFTTRLTNLFEERIQEDLNVIRESKDLISSNLIQLRQEVEQANLRHEAFIAKIESSFSSVAEIAATNQQAQVSQFKQHLSETKQMLTGHLEAQKASIYNVVEGIQGTHSKLESSFSNLFEMLAANLKSQASQLKQHLSEVKVASEDHLDDTKDALMDIIKTQKRENRDVMEEIQSTHKSILEELVTQGTRQQANLELLQRLQLEIMDLNQQDLQMISKLMQEV